MTAKAKPRRKRRAFDFDAWMCSIDRVDFDRWDVALRAHRLGLRHGRAAAKREFPNEWGVKAIGRAQRKGKS